LNEGASSAGPLVLPLTAATVEATEELAGVPPGGRIQTPMLGVLDETANVHYASGHQHHIP
jgi:hypothetical protein